MSRRLSFEEPLSAGSARLRYYVVEGSQERPETEDVLGDVAPDDIYFDKNGEIWEKRA